MRACVIVNNTESLIPCALAGLGLVQVPRLSIEAQLGSGELLEVLPGFRPEPLAVSIADTERRLLSARIRVVVDWCINCWLSDCRKRSLAEATESYGAVMTCTVTCRARS